MESAWSLHGVCRPDDSGWVLSHDGTWQVGLRVWFFALFALDSIAVAAQGLVPVAMASAGMEKARWISDRLLRWGGLGGTLSGILLGLLASYIPAV